MTHMLAIREPDEEGESQFSVKPNGRVYLALHHRSFDRAVDLIMAAKPELRDWIFHKTPMRPEAAGLSLGVHALAMREVTGEDIA